MIELNLDPDNRQLKQFGLISLVGFPLLGWAVAGFPVGTWDVWDIRIVGGFAVLGLILGLCAATKPSWLKWVFISLSVVAFPIGFLVSEIVLLTIFLIAFVPLALWFRVIGRDALQRSIDRQADSYWQPKRQPKDAASYYRQS